MLYRSLGKDPQDEDTNNPNKIKDSAKPESIDAKR